MEDYQYAGNGFWIDVSLLDSLFPNLDNTLSVSSVLYSTFKRNANVSSSSLIPMVGSPNTEMSLSHRGNLNQELGWCCPSSYLVGLTIQEFPKPQRGSPSDPEDMTLDPSDVFGVFGDHGAPIRCKRLIRTGMFSQ
jgi:hypothetical protein